MNSTPEGPGAPDAAVAEDQRRRLITATATVLAERGYGALTVRRVVESAGVSRTTFYANFDNKRDCVLAAHRDIFERLLRSLLLACSTEREWPARIAAAIAALFAFAERAPAELRLLTLSATTADLLIAKQIVDSNAHLVDLLRDGRRHSPCGPALPDLAEEALIGALATILGTRLLDGDLEGLEGEVVQLMLAPYLGQAEAARVASRPRPARSP